MSHLIARLIDLLTRAGLIPARRRIHVTTPRMMIMKRMIDMRARRRM